MSVDLIIITEFVLRVVLANLLQQLILAVAKHTEGMQVVDAADGAIGMEQEQTTQWNKCPNSSRILQ